MFSLCIFQAQSCLDGKEVKKELLYTGTTTKISWKYWTEEDVCGFSCSASEMKASGIADCILMPVEVHLSRDTFYDNHARRTIPRPGHRAVMATVSENPDINKVHVKCVGHKDAQRVIINRCVYSIIF